MNTHQTTIINGLGKVLGLYTILIIKVSNGVGHFQFTVGGLWICYGGSYVFGQH